MSRSVTLRAASTCSMHSRRLSLQFDVYDDLSKFHTDADRLDPANARTTLGGSQEWPYPRRLCTGGAKRQHAGGEPVVCSASRAGCCCTGNVCCLVVPALLRVSTDLLCQQHASSMESFQLAV